jgi:hypothetical protein
MSFDKVDYERTGSYYRCRGCGGVLSTVRGRSEGEIVVIRHWPEECLPIVLGRLHVLERVVERLTGEAVP